MWNDWKLIFVFPIPDVLFSVLFIWCAELQIAMILQITPKLQASLWETLVALWDWYFHGDQYDWPS